MMIGRLAGWTVLVLLAASAGLGAAVDFLEFSTMTWSHAVADTTTIVLCTDQDLTGADIHLIVLPTDGASQTDYPGDVDADQPSCAVFTAVGYLPVPTDLTKYELTVSDATSELQSGATSFAFPLGEGVAIDCGGTFFGRFSVADATALDSAWSCRADATDGNVCYVATDGDTNYFCVAGLDDDNPTFQVCVVNAAPVSSTTEGLFGVTSLTYGSTGSTTGTIAVSYQGLIGKSMDLLGRVQGGDGAVSVGECIQKVCTFGDFAPSPNIYELCGVFTDDTGVTDVGTNTFQDLQLTVDAVDATEVIFRFVNKDPLQKEPGLYEVESGSDESLGGTGFTLDCTQIPADGMCSGFFIEDPPPQMIAVSYDNQNKVFSPVPAFISGAKEHVEQSKYASAADFIQKKPSPASLQESANEAGLTRGS